MQRRMIRALLKVVQNGILACMNPSFYHRCQGIARVMLAALGASLATSLDTSPVYGQAGVAAAAAHPARVSGVSAARLARLDSLLDGAVADSSITGAVALVLRDGHVMYQRSVGWADRASNRRMTPDAIFRIASQTKALTSVAILSLVEQGRLTLDDPVSKFVPSFAKTTVLDSGMTTPVAARRAITIRDLLTHTAGISYGGEAQVAALYRAKGLGYALGFGFYFSAQSEPICTLIDRLGTLPFVKQPGTAFVYGYNTDILGCVVERVSGLALDEFIRVIITAPLQMTDTHFFLPTSQRARLATVYASDSVGHSVRAQDGPSGQGDYVDGPRRSFSGGAGLLSTASDYARFLQMMLNHGVLDGARILAPRTIDVMTSNQSGTLYATDGRGFGLGFSTVDRLGADGFKSVGSYGWGGAYGSSYTVDPAERLVIVFMLQQIPNSSNVASRFTNMVYQALIPAGK